MEIEKLELEKRMALFETICRQEGIKLTHQRMEIYREVACTGDHPNAEEVYQRVRERLPTVSLDTVYRTLWLLNDLGLIKTLRSHRERTRFDANLSGHHHFICEQCGFTQDFYSTELDNFTLPDSVVNSLGDMETIHFEVRGICRNCVADKTPQNSSNQ
jgi:Fur family peroxide stress response transcriptional regulator